MTQGQGLRRRRVLAGGVGSLALAGCASGSADPAHARPLRRVGVGSCMRQTDPQPLWDMVLADRPDLFIFAGDNVYASDAPWSRERLSEAYRVQAAVPGFARLRASVPSLAIWDDHDYGLNDGGAEFVHKAQSKEEFLRFWQVPANDARCSREGLHHVQRFGPEGRTVQVIVLDTRWFRSPLKPTDARRPGQERYLPDDDPAKTILGSDQWQWLADTLKQPAKLRLIVSSIQVLPEGHGWERWGNFPRERERLIRTIAETRAEGVVFLSGDRHVGALYREAAGTPYPLYELTSSGITHPWRAAREAGPNRLGELFTEPHYGMVEIDWEAGQLILAVKDGQAHARRHQAIDFLELKARR